MKALFSLCFVKVHGVTTRKLSVTQHSHQEEENSLWLLAASMFANWIKVHKEESLDF